MIDERTLQAVHDAMLECTNMQLALGRADLMEMAQVAVEAYEAVKWRPIEEAPQDGRDVVICLGLDDLWMAHLESDGSWLLDGRDDAYFWADMTERGARFYAIEPPQANASKSSS